MIEGGACFGVTAELLLPEKSELGFEFSALLAEPLFALAGALREGASGADLLAQAAELAEQGAVLGVVAAALAGRERRRKQG